MSFVCLSIRSWATGGESRPATSVPANNGEKKAADSGVSSGVARRMLRLGAALMRVVPHVHVDGREQIWADARGLSASQVAESVLAVAMKHAGEDVRVGVARTPIAAEIAARDAGPNANRML